MKIKQLLPISLWALAWIAAPISFAAPSVSKTALYCESTARLNDRITGCVDNETVFGDAAVACLERFEKEAEDAGKLLAKTLVGSGDSAEKIKKQQGHFAGSEKNFADASAKLTFLIGLGNIALGQVQDYKHNLAAPEDVENAGQMGFTLEQFLASIPCFDDNRKLLDDVAKDFRAKIKELEAAKGAAKKMEALAKASKTKINRNDSISAEPVSATKGKGEEITVKKKPKNGKSDITGTEKKKSVLPK